MIKRIVIIFKVMILVLAMITLVELVFYLIRWIITGKGVDNDKFPAYFKYIDQITES